MTKQFRARCTVMQDGYVNPDVVEIYNIDDPNEVYPAGRNQFRINHVVTEDEFYLAPFQYGDEVWMVAYRKPVIFTK